MQVDVEFSGKSVVITGAGGGLGTALVSLFASRGARVIACDKALDGGSDEGVAEQFLFDLSDSQSASDSAARLLDSEGTPDIVINNAGWTSAERLENLDLEIIGHEIGLNLTGVMCFTDTISKAMAERGYGAIVFVSSVNALIHLGNPAYSAAKAGVNAYGRAIAVELGGAGVRANVVCPGSIRTPAWDRRIARDCEIPAKLARHYPLERIVNVGEVAEAIAFLASDRASGITGAVLPVDAGLTAGQCPFIADILGT